MGVKNSNYPFLYQGLSKKRSLLDNQNITATLSLYGKAGAAQVGCPGVADLYAAL